MRNRPSQTLVGKRIVVVEDEGVTQMMIRQAVQKAGMLVVGAANNGKSGVEIVLRERPDMVLMDIRMPIMNGMDAARLILAQYSCCMVMLTAFASDDYDQRSLEIGAVAYLHKPILGVTLIARLEEAWEKYLAR